MKQKSLKVGLLAAVVGALTMVSVTFSNADSTRPNSPEVHDPARIIQETPPERPPWVDEHGRSDPSQMPDQMPVLDEEGSVVGYVTPEELLAHPSGVPGEKSQRGSSPVVRDDEGHPIGRLTESGFQPFQ